MQMIAYVKQISCNTKHNIRFHLILKSIGGVNVVGVKQVKNEFTFWPIGQGLFYTGIIKNFIFVYDIGVSASYRSQYLDNSILEFEKSVKKAKKNDSKIIDVLFLSHYDIDHISGIKKLKARGFTILKIIAPLITPLDELSWLKSIADSTDSNSTSANASVVRYDLKAEISRVSESVTFVVPIADQGNFEQQFLLEREEGQSIDIEELGNNMESKVSGLTTMNLRGIWEFKFYVQSYHALWIKKWFDELINYLDSKYGTNLKTQTGNAKTNKEIADKIYTVVNQYCLGNSTNDLELLIDEIRREAKKLKIKKEKANKISLILYHRPINISLNYNQTLRKRYFTKTHRLHLYSLNAQLLTGDSVFVNINKIKNISTPTNEWNVFQSELRKFKNIGVMLLPHHGAKYGWQPALLWQKCCFVVSYGLKNSYHHPDPSVVKSILSSFSHFNGRLIYVNERPKNRLSIIVHIP